MVSFETDPSRYRHWRLSFDGPIATLAMAVDEDGGLREGYKLKLNSYDLGVDIEFHDAVQRIRFEHPEVRTVILTSARERMFCAGANIYMLGTSGHGWKVNFCKFTNETRNGLEDSSAATGLKFLCAVNGACAGGGYEIALACDEIVMVDDRSTTVSLPEVPLLGVLPGTGGLTRLTDKRKMRRDLADVFCTSPEGVRAERAREWKLVDHIARPVDFDRVVRERATALAATSDRPGGKGVALAKLQRAADAGGYRYSSLDVSLDAGGRTATFILKAPEQTPPTDIAAIEAQGAEWWPLRFARELDDAILSLRVNQPEIGLWVLRSSGDAEAVLAAGSALLRYKDHWRVRETIGLWRRTLQRLDVSSRSLFAVIDAGSCFAGLFFEVALAADRIYMLDAPDDNAAPLIVLDEFSFNNLLATPARRTRLALRFQDDERAIASCRGRLGQTLDAPEALKLGLVTFTPDELDWEDEIRLAIEERASLSPDALTGLEANLRFGGAETMLTRIFGRLSAWQNWIFNRPNAVGEKGALKLFGSGSKARFDWERV